MSTRIAAAVAELVEALRDELVRTAPDPAAPDRLYSLSEAADVLGIKRTRLYSEIGAGRLRTLHAGKRHLVAASAIREFVEGRGGGAADESRP